MDNSNGFVGGEDVHICGMCRAQYSDVTVFMEHKKIGCPVMVARQHTNHDLPSNMDVPGYVSIKEGQTDAQYQGQTDTQTDAQYQGQTDTQYQGQTDTQMDTQTDTQYRGQMDTQTDAQYQGVVHTDNQTLPQYNTQPSPYTTSNVSQIVIQVDKGGGTFGYLQVSDSQTGSQLSEPLTGSQLQMSESQTGTPLQMSAPLTGTHVQVSAQQTGSQISVSDPRTGSQLQVSGQEIGTQLQLSDNQTGSHTDLVHNTPITAVTQYTETQSEYVDVENDGQNDGIQHEYVLLQAPLPEFQYKTSGVDFQTGPQTSTEPVYTLDSHSIQSSIPSLQNTTLISQGEEHFYQPSTNTNTPTSQLAKQLTENILTGSSSQNLESSLSTTRIISYDSDQKSRQTSLRGMLTGTHMSDNQTGIQDGYISSTDQQQIQYTLAGGLQANGESHLLETKAPYDTTIQYTLTSMVQPSGDNEGSQTITSDVIDLTPPGRSLRPAKSTEDTMVQGHATTTPQAKRQAKEELAKMHKVFRENLIQTLKIESSKYVEPVKVKTPLEKKYVCNDCPYKTAYLKDLERHYRTHTGEKPFKCKQCNKCFTRNDKLMLHIKYHKNERAFNCTLCDYSAVENGSLKKHMRTHTDERPFSCQVCPYKSRSSGQLQIHLRIHTGDTPYQCVDCGAKFKVKSDLKRHQRVHSGEKPYTCRVEECDYRCSIKSNLLSHYKSHHKPDQQMSCTDCEYKTSSKKAYFEHRKTHNTKADLTCPTCSYQCSNKSALCNHIKLHSSGTPNQCNYCSYTSVQYGNIQAHMRRKHPSKVLPRKGGRKSKLEAIFKKKTPAEDSEDLNKFKAGKIRCPKNYRCDQCSAAFVREDSLKCHLKQHKDGCSSLSTAYAVLKLQQPVINVSNTDTATSGLDATNSQVELSTPDKLQNESVDTQQQIILQRDPNLQHQTVSLGINHILMAAGMSGLNSSGDSPTFRTQTDQSPFQDLQKTSPSTTPVTLQSSTGMAEIGEDGVPNMIVGQSLNDVPNVQVMQNISLPYIRLPNGQVLILTGQNPLGRLISQSDSVNVQDPSLVFNGGMPQIQPQIFAQQPTTEQQQIIQSPADSTSQTVGTTITPQQPGAIPIQIILPNDSQQSMPLVSQLLNSVINRGTSSDTTGCAAGSQSASVIADDNKIGMGSVNDGVQSFVVQIPTQSGMEKDATGNVPESQSFVLQIPPTNNLN